MASQPVIHVHREGNTVKVDPFTIAIIANPALERPEGSGTFVVDPIVSQQAAFDTTTAYTVDCLFGDLPGQAEKLLGHPDIRDEVRVVSLFAAGLNAEDMSSLVAEDDPHQSSQIHARRTKFRPFLNRFGLDADIAFAISASPTHDVSTALETSDDDMQGGVPFAVNGVTLFHVMVLGVLTTVSCTRQRFPRSWTTTSWLATRPVLWRVRTIRSPGSSCSTACVLR